MHLLIFEKKLGTGFRVTHEGIIAEMRRMRVQALVGTRENGLRIMRSSRDDGSTVR